MQPFLHELMPIMRALDTFNFQALQQLKTAEEEREKLEMNGTSRAPLVVLRKRSAADANLDKIDGRPPMKRSVTSSVKVVEKLVVKNGANSAQVEDAMSDKGREERIRLQYSSPLAHTSKLPGRSRSPNQPAVKDPGPSNRDSDPSRDYMNNSTSISPPISSNARTNMNTSTNGTNNTNERNKPNRNPSNSSRGNVHPSRMQQVQFALPISPTKPRSMPRLSSRDPRLFNKKSNAKDR